MTRRVEITLHVIGGPEGYPTQFGPKEVPVTATDDAHESWCIEASTTANLWMRVEFTDWTALPGSWLSGIATVSDINGYPLGRRPFLLYDKPYDVGVPTNFRVSDSHVVMTLRRY